MPCRLPMLLLAVCTLTACDEAGSSASAPAPSGGRRTSIPGKAMDRAEDLQKEVAEYNRQIEQTIEQGAAPEPKKPGRP